MSLTKSDSPDGCGGVEQVDPREYAEWSLTSQLDDYRREYGDETLAEQIDAYMTERGLY